MALRLNKPLDHFLWLLTEREKPDEMNESIDTLETMLQKEQFEEAAFTASSKLENIQTESNTWYQSYLRFIKHGTDYRRGAISHETLVEEFKHLLSPEYDLVNEINFLGARILNTLAFSFSENNRYDEAFVYFNRVINMSQRWHQRPAAQDPSVFRLRMIFNKAKALYDVGEYDETITLCLQGIEESKEQEKISLAGNFYYYIGQSYEQLGLPFEDISDAYKNTEFFLSFLNREVNLKTLRGLKGHYLRE